MAQALGCDLGRVSWATCPFPRPLVIPGGRWGSSWGLPPQLSPQVESLEEHHSPRLSTLPSASGPALTVPAGVFCLRLHLTNVFPLLLFFFLTLCASELYARRGARTMTLRLSGLLCRLSQPGALRL